MDIEYTEEQKILQKAVREFASKEIAPGAAERDKTGKFPVELYNRIGELGFTCVFIPPEFGGAGQGLLEWALIVEGISRFDLSLGVTLHVAGAGARKIVEYGSEEQKRRWLPPLAKGEAIAAVGYTEPDTGTDLRRIKTTATLIENEWVINGAKIFITNAGAPITSFLVILARDGEGYSQFIVPSGTPGLDILPKFKKMGMRSSDIREFHLTDCRIPKENFLEPRGKALSASLADLAFGRVILSSDSLGIAEACFEEGLNYAKTRIAFGRPIASFQYIQSMLVDMSLNVELGRLIRDKAAWLYDQGRPSGKISSMSKLVCSEGARKNADFCVQIFGGMGFMDDCVASRYFRDARGLTLADGTSEAQKMTIARALTR